MRGVSGVDVYSMVVATTGAVVFLVVYHALFSGSPLQRS
jgi:hypothetical protein